MSKSSERNGVLAGGNFIIDTVKIIDKWPEQDALCSVISKSKSNGGGPYNILKNLARLDSSISLEACGLLGEDLDASWVLEDCASEGIDTSQLVQLADSITSTTDAMTDIKTGRRTFFHGRGANAQLTEADFDFRSTRAKIFSLGYVSLLDKLDELDKDGTTGASRVLRAAKDAGLITAVDMVSSPHLHYREIAIASLREADVFFVNELEASWILKTEVDEGNMREAVREIVDLGSPGTVVLHLPSGAVAYSRNMERVIYQPSVDFPSEKILGSTGAGDAFATGFIYGVHEGWIVQDSLECAVAVAACSLMHSTPSAGVQTVESCLELIDVYGFK